MDAPSRFGVLDFGGDSEPVPVKVLQSAEPR
jgi:hypothetical protein